MQRSGKNAVEPKQPMNPDFVTDEQGRRRFHGAFTGGFSAGHFNTVGSVEGFQPTRFVSSRESRADFKSVRQTAASFMDEEDMVGSAVAEEDELEDAVVGDELIAPSQDRVSF